MIPSLETSPGNTAATRLQTRGGVVEFAIPIEDTDEFHSLGIQECGRVRRMLGVLRDIAESGMAVRNACKFEARKLAVEGVRGWSWSRIKNTYYEFTGGKKIGSTVLFEKGDWRMLARWQRQAHTGLSGRPEFKRLWQRLCDNHQRSSSGAFSDLASLYTTGYTRAGQKVDGVVWGEKFPGYDGWPDAVPHTGLPEGWTKNNLAKHTPDKFERTAARTGIKKASGEGLKARFSRVGVMPYQIMSADDLQLDVKCMVVGQRELVRARCLGLHDYATDAMVSVMMKSTWWDETAGRLRALNERDAMWFILAALTNVGYRGDTGTTIRVELGTMAVRGDNHNPERPIDDPDRRDLRALIWRATARKVTFENSGGFQKAAHGGQFAPPSGGNPRFKAIEGAWSRIHNRLDSLPGQTGKDWNHSPEASTKESDAAIQLLKTIGLLPVEQAEQVKLSHLTFNELAAQLHQAADDLNREPEHQIKEWEKCGFIVKEFFDAVAGTWHPLDQIQDYVRTLAPDHALALALALEKNPDTSVRPRRMTRAEALATGRSGLVKMPHSALLEIVGRDNAMNKGEPKAVRAGEFTFDCQEIDPDQIAFFAVDREGQPLREGARYICVVNPQSADVCVIYDEDGRFVSVCPRHWPASLTDPSATQREVGVPLHWRNAKLAPMRARHGEDAERVAFIKAHNAAVSGQRSAVSGQRAREIARNVDRFGAAAGEEILAADGPAEETGEAVASEPSAADDFLNAL